MHPIDECGPMVPMWPNFALSSCFGQLLQVSLFWSIALEFSHHDLAFRSTSRNSLCTFFGLLLLATKPLSHLLPFLKLKVPLWWCRCWPTTTFTGPAAFVFCSILYTIYTTYCINHVLPPEEAFYLFNWIRPDAKKGRASSARLPYFFEVEIAFSCFEVEDDW